jgi:hypothetical protein
MRSSVFERGEMCGSVVGYLAALIAMAAISGGVTVEAELAYGVGELADLVRAAMEINDPLAVLGPIGGEATGSTWAENVLILQLGREPTVWKLVCEHFGTAEWSPERIKHLRRCPRDGTQERARRLCGVRAVDPVGARTRRGRGLRGGACRGASIDVDREAIVSAVEDAHSAREAHGPRQVRRRGRECSGDRERKRERPSAGEVRLRCGAEPDGAGNEEASRLQYRGIFDNYAPTTAEIDSVWGNVEEKVRRKQTRRVVINVDSSPVDLAKLREAFEDQPIDDLEQVLVVNGNSVTELWP